MTIPKDAKHVTRESIVLAISFMFLAMVLFTTANTFVKYLGGLNPSPLQIVFFRNLIPLAGLYIYFQLHHKVTPRINRQVIKDFAPRSVFSTFGLSCLFYAYMHGNLSDVTAISFTSPLFISILAIPMLNEHLSWQRFVGLLVGFGGVLVITRPEGDIHWSGFFALLYAVSAAYLMVTDRKLRHHYTSAEIVFYFSMGCSVISFTPTLLLWHPPSTIEWLALGIIGVLGGLAQLCIALAYRRANATVVAQTAYVSVVIAAIYNYYLFHVSPTIHLIIGSLMIAVGGIYIVMYERKQ